MRFVSLVVIRKLSGICLLALVCLVGMNGKLIAAKPNILFVLVDDQSPFDLKIYNHFLYNILLVLFFLKHQVRYLSYYM